MEPRGFDRHTQLFDLGLVDGPNVWKLRITHLHGHSHFPEDSDYGIEIRLYRNSQSTSSISVCSFLHSHIDAPLRFRLQRFVVETRKSSLLFLLAFQRLVVQSSIEVGFDRRWGSLHLSPTTRSIERRSSSSHFKYFIASETNRFGGRRALNDCSRARMIDFFKLFCFERTNSNKFDLFSSSMIFRATSIWILAFSRRKKCTYN